MAKKKPPKKKHQEQKKRQSAITPRTYSPTVPPVTRRRAPPPIRPVGESEWPWLPSQPVQLPELPDDYPAVLKTPTEKALLKAERQFSNRSQLGEFCLCFIGVLTPYVKSSVKQGGLRSDAAMEAVWIFIWHLIALNCGPLRTAAKEFIQSVRTSDAWCNLVDSTGDTEISTEKPERLAPTPKESAAKEEELSYDENTQILKFRGISYIANSIQFAVIKCLYDADARGSAGMSRKALIMAVALLSNTRVQNLFQRQGQRLYKDLIAYDRHSKLYRFKPPRSKPHPK
jgi:hypothetical protein